MSGGKANGRKATGRCLCGAVQVSIRNISETMGVCHCENCRRWTGLAMMAISVEPGDIAVVGSGNVATYRSSDWATRSFCSVCGSTLWYRLTIPTPEQGRYEIPMGLLDDPNGIRLTHEIYIDRKPDGYAFAGPTEQKTAAEFEASVAASLQE